MPPLSCDVENSPRSLGDSSSHSESIDHCNRECAATIACENETADIDKKSKKAVHFQEFAVEYDYIHVTEYSDQEKLQCWYKSQDYREIQESNRADLEAAARMHGDGKDYPCTRGLEGSTLDGARRRRANKAAASDAVLDEQLLQVEEGYVDAELLADVYFAHSFHCGLHARLQAAQDREEAL